MKKALYAFFSLLAVCFMITLTQMNVSASSINPRYTIADAISTTLSISNNQANCSVFVMGKSETARISGTIKLYDDTARETVKTWSISTANTYYTFNKNVAVTSGHTYTLSFSGYLYNGDGDSEYVYGSDSATNQGETAKWMWAGKWSIASLCYPQMRTKDTERENFREVTYDK